MSFIGGFLGFGTVAESLDQGTMEPGVAFALASKAIGCGFAAGLLFAVLGYLIIARRFASRRAATLDLTVEGAFLRIRQHALVESDRKLHFRSIVDYSANQDFLMRQFGIQALQMATTAGGHNAILTIPGIRDCIRIRDLLAEIDAHRELR